CAGNRRSAAVLRASLAPRADDGHRATAGELTRAGFHTLVNQARTDRLRATRLCRTAQTHRVARPHSPARCFLRVDAARRLQSTDHHRAFPATGALRFVHSEVPGVAVSGSHARAPLAETRPHAE